MTKFDLEALAYNYFQEFYNNSYRYSKLVNGVIVDNCSHFTFAEDMSVYGSKQDIDAYILRNLKRFKKSGLQSYFEMILAVEALSWVFYKAGEDELSNHLSVWNIKLKNLDGSKFYRDYISEEQLNSIYNLD